MIGGKYYQDICDSCASGSIRNPDSSAAEYHRQRQREDHRADILQPHQGGRPNLEFAKQYPEQWENHYTAAEIKQIRREL